MTTTDSPAQAALARLVADQRRNDGVTAWCDDHRPDVELVVRELGVSALARAVGILDTTLYSYVERRQMERRDMRFTLPAPEAPAPPTVTPEASGAPAPPRRSAPRRRRTDTMAQPEQPTPPDRESADYYRGYADGMLRAVELLAGRP